jgi:hypothetical protein
LRLFGAQPPNSDANSRLEADGSGLPVWTTLDAGAGGAVEAVEAETNSARGVALAVNSWRGWRLARADGPACAGAVARPLAVAEAALGTGAAVCCATCRGWAARALCAGARAFTTTAPPPIAAADAAIAANLPADPNSVAAWTFSAAAAARS